MRKSVSLLSALTLAIPVPSRLAAQNGTPASPCGRVADSEKVTCYQSLLTAKLHSDGVPGAMQLLQQLVTTEREVRDNSHMFAHMLGLAAYTTPAELPRIFRQCSPNFQSGCYHGVIQAYFLDRHHGSAHGKITPAEVNGLCKDFRGGDDAWLRFQCVHGLGHGLEFVYAHELPRSLAGCDLVADKWERSGCYG